MQYSKRLNRVGNKVCHNSVEIDYTTISPQNLKCATCKNNTKSKKYSLDDTQKCWCDRWNVRIVLYIKKIVLQYHINKLLLPLLCSEKGVKNKTMLNFILHEKHFYPAILQFWISKVRLYNLINFKYLVRRLSQWHKNNVKIEVSQSASFWYIE